MKIARRYPRLGSALFALAMMGACGKHGQVVDNLRAVQTVIVHPSSATIKVGASTILVPEVDADAGVTTTVSWKTTNPLIASVAQDGTVTGVAPGTAFITATSNADQSVSGFATVTVTAPGIISVGVAPASASVTAGGTQLFTATVSADPGATDLSVAWSSNSPSVATVNASTGLATAVSQGSATITATSNLDHGKSASGTLTVTVPSFTTYNGSYGGIVNLTTNTATPGAMGLLPQCAGSSTDYNEAFDIAINALGVGTVTMRDAPTFPRVYNITLSPGLSATSSGTFPFFGSSIPGWMSIQINGTNVTFRETTQYGACANSYAGTLMKY